MDVVPTVRAVLGHAHMIIKKIPGSLHFSIQQVTKSWAGPGNEAMDQQPEPLGLKILAGTLRVKTPRVTLQRI